jgi:hypothetical protein
MKTLNHLLVAASAVLAVNVALATQAGESCTLEKPEKNIALLASPRYLEDHPELLRTGSAVVASPAQQAKRLAELIRNSALASSPRFREEHSELLWAASTAEARQTVGETDGLSGLTDNEALASSPRFREKHPEHFRRELQLENAPSK